MAQNSLVPHLAAATRTSPPRPLLADLARTVNFMGAREEDRQELQPTASHDLAAISSDWAAVGNDLRYAMEWRVQEPEHER